MPGTTHSTATPLRKRAGGTRKYKSKLSVPRQSPQGSACGIGPGRRGGSNPLGDPAQFPGLGVDEASAVRERERRCRRSLARVFDKINQQENGGDQDKHGERKLRK